MNKLVKSIEHLKHSNIQKKIRQRIQQFKNIDRTSNEDLFMELCFCILTANFSAKRAIHIHAKLHDCFYTDTKESLSKKLREQGYRFPNIRAIFIKEACVFKDQLSEVIQNFDGDELRAWLVANIPGFGLKEASHYLRNIGYDKYAIIDSHILDVLHRYRLIKKPTTLTARKYKEIEQVIQRLATRTGLTCAELDLYLWYMETGTILK
ncbi:MAG: N-glycosylase/DNA lyase [Candidatus Thermoplasmatota archaeon]|nr:N-glycosylase/DNA lyase [Candidatus Thermoplasmatota archaeon]